MVFTLYDAVEALSDHGEGGGELDFRVLKDILVFFTDPHQQFMRDNADFYIYIC